MVASYSATDQLSDAMQCSTQVFADDHAIAVNVQRGKRKIEEGVMHFNYCSLPSSNAMLMFTYIAAFCSSLPAVGI